MNGGLRAADGEKYLPRASQFFGSAKSRNHRTRWRIYSDNALCMHLPMFSDQSIRIEPRLEIHVQMAEKQRVL
jgi:hypothetical protein